MVHLNLVIVWKGSEILSTLILFYYWQLIFVIKKINDMYSGLFIFIWLSIFTCKLMFCHSRSTGENVKFGCYFKTINKCWKRCRMKSCFFFFWLFFSCFVFFFFFGVVEHLMVYYSYFGGTFFKCLQFSNDIHCIKAWKHNFS